MDDYITRYMNDNNIHLCDIEEVTSSSVKGNNSAKSIDLFVISPTVEASPPSWIEERFRSVE